MLDKIKKNEKIVLDALQTNERTRKDDFILYGAVLKRMGVDLTMTLAEFLATAKIKKMPPFESISRCRRHILELMPELCDEQTRDAREDETYDYMDYSLTGIGDDDRR